MPSRIAAVLSSVVAIVVVSCSQNSQELTRKYVASGDEYAAKKNYSEAVIQYRKAVSKDPSAGEARLKLGDAYTRTGDKNNALREYVRAADLLPNNTQAQLRAAKGLLESGQFADAKERALGVLKNEPKNVDALVLAGYSMAALKDLDGAISHVEQAVDADPRNVMVYTNLGLLELAKGGRPAAESALKRAVEVAPKSSDAHLSLANFYWAGNQVADAEREFKTALELDPESSVGNRAFAVFYTGTGRPAEAEPYFKRYVAVSKEVEARIVLADYYLAANRTKDALAELDGLVQTPDGFVVAKLRLAAIDYTNKRKPEAYSALDEIFKREPKNDSALIQKSRFLYSDGKYAEALVAANTATEVNPASPQAHYVRGLALEATGAFDDATKAFQDVLKLSPNAVAGQVELAKMFLLRGDSSAAAEFLGQALKSQPRSYLVRFLLARALIGSGQLARADAEVSAVARTTPNSSDAQNLVGDYYMAKRDTSHAKEAFARAFELNPKSMHALTSLVRIDFLEGKPDAARSLIEDQLKKTAPNSSATLLALAGKTYYSVHDSARAEKMFRDSLALDPTNIDAYASLGALLKSEGRLDQARGEYEEVSRRLPKNAVVAKTMVGIILSLQDKHDEAAKQYEQALALDPRSAVAANNLAWEYAERGANLDVALSLAQTAKARMPNSSEVSDTLGWVYYKKGLASLAITAFLQGAEQEPNKASLHYHLGLAYLKNGDRSNARRSMDRAVTLDPQLADQAKQALATPKG